MEISNEKISELLKNPEIVGMIASLASGFSSGASDPVTDTETKENGAEDKAIAVKNDAVEAFSDTASGISSVNFPKSNAYGDKRIALLQAIKPYITDTKKDKVDSLVKAIGVAGMLNTYSGTIFSGLFGNK